jgi:hypothetical protein
MELPVVELPLFVFPHGLQLLCCDAGNFPLPLFFTFLFTDAKGENYFAACLQFYELVPASELEEVCKEIFCAGAESVKGNGSTAVEDGSTLDEGSAGPDAEAEAISTVNSAAPASVCKTVKSEYCSLPTDKCIFTPKVICVLSKMPFYR